jgi:hypothetical protein
VQGTPVSITADPPADPLWLEVLRRLGLGQDPQA